MEMMIVLSVAAVILAIGAPNFTEFSRNNRLTAAANDLLAATQLARTEAITRQRTVTLCTSDNPQSASPTCSNTSFRGWIVFEDDNANCQREAAEPKPLRAADTLDASIHASQDEHCATFDPSGYVRTNGGNAPLGHLIFCDARGLAEQGSTNQSAARALMLSRTGRAQVTRDPALIVSWNLACQGGP